jgi:hypothetical protein
MAIEVSGTLFIGKSYGVREESLVVVPYLLKFPNSKILYELLFGMKPALL